MSRIRPLLLPAAALASVVALVVAVPGIYWIWGIVVATALGLLWGLKRLLG